MPTKRAFHDLERSPGKNDNWVEQAGSLPRYIERIAAHLHHERGMTISRSIATAVNKVKEWARGGDNVTAVTKAKAAKAVAEWEALKAKNRSKSIAHAAILLETKKHREFSKEEREKLSKSGDAMPDGSYPIPDKGALRRAIQSFGRAKNKDAVKRHIVKRAKALDASDMLPEDWGDTKSLPDLNYVDFSSILGEEPDESKGSEDVDIEFKSVGVNGVDVIDDEKGIVSTIVSVTGLRDGVKDVIHAGAYKDSLNTRTPKGVWSHKWEIPVAKTLEVKELPAGDSDLPKRLHNGKRWPKEAGALAIKTQFNLDTQRGREAYSDVVFFDDQQEWSIGYRVPPGGAKMDKKTGERHIHKLDLYEYSPVLFGAMPAARTQKVHNEAKSAEDIETVHDAQVEYKSRTLSEDEFLEWKSILAEGVEVPDWLEAKKSQDDDEDESAEENYEDVGKDEELEIDPDDEDEDPDDSEKPESEEPDDDEEDPDDDEEEKSYPLSGYERETLIKTWRQIGEVLGYDVKSIDAEIEAKGDGDKDYDDVSTLVEAVKKCESAVGEKYDDMLSLAEDFDKAVDDDDTNAVNEAADGLLDILEDMDTSDEDAADAVEKIATMVEEKVPEDEEEEPEEQEETPDDSSREKPGSGREKKRGEKSFEESGMMTKVSVDEIDMMRKSLLDHTASRRKNR